MHRWKTFFVAVVVNGIVVGLCWQRFPQLVMMIAPAVFASVPLINTWMEERRSPTPVSVQGFGLHERSLVLFGAIMMFVSVQFTVFVSQLISRRILQYTLGIFLLRMPVDEQFSARFSGLETGAQQAQQAALAVATELVLVLWGCPLFFLVGRWMGRRSMAHVPMARRVLAVVCASAISVVASTMVALLTLSGALGVEYRATQEALSYMDVLSSGTVVLLFVFVPALCGYWRGRRQVLGAYMGFLLTKVPQGTRDIIVELAYQEAAKSPAST